MLTHKIKAIRVRERTKILTGLKQGQTYFPLYYENYAPILLDAVVTHSATFIYYNLKSRSSREFLTRVICTKTTVKERVIYINCM